MSDQPYKAPESNPKPKKSIKLKNILKGCGALLAGGTFGAITGVALFASAGLLGATAFGGGLATGVGAVLGMVATGATLSLSNALQDKFFSERKATYLASFVSGATLSTMIGIVGTVIGTAGSILAPMQQPQQKETPGLKTIEYAPEKKNSLGDKELKVEFQKSLDDKTTPILKAAPTNAIKPAM